MRPQPTTTPALTYPKVAEGWRNGTLPRWNAEPFTCPGCTRHWEPNQIRLKRAGGQFMCQRCCDQNTPPRPAGTEGTKVSATDALRSTPCATCGQPFADRRIVANVNGHLVHYRCPNKQALTK